MTKAPPILAAWSRAELLALRPPSGLTVSEWAAKYRRIPPGRSSRPGKWDNAVAPYTVEPMDTMNDPACRYLSLCWCAQAAKSEVLLNQMGFGIDQDPDPMMIVQKKPGNAANFNLERVQPMLEASAQLRQHKTGRPRDMKNDKIVLVPCELYFAGAGSESDLASRPIRYLFMDEAAKYPVWTGREAQAMDLAEERTTTFPTDAWVAAASTPVLTTDLFWQKHQDTDRRRFWVPCPKCSRYQTLDFNFDRVKWPSGATWKEIRDGSLAWYVCRYCRKKILDRGAILQHMLERGVWCPTEKDKKGNPRPTGGGKISKRGKITGVKLDSPMRGYQLGSLYSPFRGISKTAAKWLQAKGNPTRMMHWRNSWDGLPWEDSTKGLRESEVDDLIEDRPSNVVPNWAKGLVAASDLGGPENGPWTFEWGIRAFGDRMRSALICEGTLITKDFSEFEELIFKAYPDALGNEYRVQLCVLDEGWLTATVRDWVRPKYPQIMALKGLESAPTPVTEKTFDGCEVLHVDTNYVKDYLATLMRKPAGDPGRWTLPRDVRDVHKLHLVSEHKVPALKRATRRGRHLATVWDVKPGLGSPHGWDKEVYVLAAAMRLGWHMFGESPETAPANPRELEELANASEPISRRRRREQAQEDPWIEETEEGWFDDD